MKQEWRTGLVVKVGSDITQELHSHETKNAAHVFVVKILKRAVPWKFFPSNGSRLRFDCP